MSLMHKVKVVMDMLSDTNVRLDLAQTITFLFDVYRSGRASEDQIRVDLRELFMSLVNVTRPELAPEERSEVASQLAEEFLNTFKLEGALKRLIGKYR
ncbi:MAG: hypothetical protein QW512_00360 [Thermofilaceae archaeon]